MAELGRCAAGRARFPDLELAGFDPRTGRLGMSAHIGPGLADCAGRVRCGVLAGLVADAMTAAAELAGGAQPRLISQTNNYLTDCRPGELAGEVAVLASGGARCLVKAELRGPDGERVVVAHGVLAVDSG